MLDVPNPVTSSFLVGIACGVCLAIIALRALRRWQTRDVPARVAARCTDVVPPEVDADLRIRSRMFAEATGRPAAAPFVYSAIRDLAIVRRRQGRRFVGKGEINR